MSSEVKSMGRSEQLSKSCVNTFVIHIDGNLYVGKSNYDVLCVKTLFFSFVTKNRDLEAKCWLLIAI